MSPTPFKVLSAVALTVAVSVTPAATAHAATAPLNLYGARVAAANYANQYPSLNVIANTPQASWLGPDWDPNPASGILSMEKAAGGKTLQLVVYGIPNRDNGGYSSGGAANASSYYAWVGAIAWALGNYPAIVDLEPDALGLSQQLNAADAAARLQMLSTAVTILKGTPAKSTTKVYIDASTWIGATQQASLLKQANVGYADGFALNTSGFNSNAFNYSYGNTLSPLVGGKHYIIDTSRNGRGSNGQWCNPAGRGLGALPQKPAGQPLVDALLWLKHPGESDGTCNGGPGAGQFWANYALGVVSHANYSTN
jgi:endoglucanase